MITFGKCARWGGSLALALTIAFNANSAFGSLDVCQKKLEKVAGKLEATISKAITKCKDKVRANSGTNAGCTALGQPYSCCTGAAAGECAGDMEKAADTCEGAFLKIYQIGPDGDTTKSYNKLAASIAKLTDPAVIPQICTVKDLETMGHLKSGVSAPGTGDQFLVTWLAKAKEKLAIKEELFEIGDARDVLTDAIDVTNCAAGERPNLCSVRAAVWPPCHDHACTLSSGAGAELDPAGLPIGLSGRKLTLQFCTAPLNASLPLGGGHCNCYGVVSSGSCVAGVACSSSATCGVSAAGVPGDCAPNFLMLVNEPARTFQPPPVIPVSPAITVCIDSVRSEGWCDCQGVGSKVQPTFCLDHIADPLGTCSPASSNPESNCICAAGAPGSPCKTAGCTACVSSTTGARCHSGTNNGSLEASWTGASVAGDCVDLNTIQFKLLPPALCVDGGGNLKSPTACTAPGGPNAACTSAGGVVCLDSRGADALPCTHDDLVPPSAPSTVPFSTAGSTSTIEDWVGTEGTCGGGSLTTGMKCIQNNDCLGGTCGGTSFGCGTGPNLATDCSFSTGPGVKKACPILESSNLAGWSIVGSFPALDGGAGLGDNVITFTLTCS